MKTLRKIVISGGAGFIGSHLVDAFLKKNYIVFCIDNFLTGKRKNIQEHIKNSAFHLIGHDIITPLSKKERSQLTGIEAVYHLASPASPPKYKRYAVETLLVNSIGTHHMLEIAREENARFLLASTSEVYGNPLIHPQKEDYFGNVNPIGVRSCYDEGKRFAESLTINYVRKFGLDARVVRIFNTYGPKMDPNDGRVIVNFINQALRNDSLTLHGEGSQTRSFCYVSDMVQGLLLAGETQGLKGEVINIGFPKEYTISEIAGIILKIMKSSAKIVKQAPQEDDPEMRRPDISKAKKLLGWEPKVQLFEGLTKTVAYFRSI